MVMKEIREAVARGWTYPATEKKTMDTDLAEAISIEVLKLYATEAARLASARLASARLQVAKTETNEPGLGYASTRELLNEITTRIEIDGKLDYRTIDINGVAQEAKARAEPERIDADYEQASADAESNQGH